MKSYKKKICIVQLFQNSTMSKRCINNIECDTINSGGMHGMDGLRGNHVVQTIVCPLRI